MSHSNEKFLYNLVDELSKENAPIVFKGGIALQGLLNLYCKNILINRKTVDIDGNWVGKYDKEQIEKTLRKALKKVNPEYDLELVREPNEKKSMGFKIIDNKDKMVTTIDLDIKDNPFYIECIINDISHKYSSLEKIMADKLLVLSNTHILRRSKDLLDIYMITNGYKVNMQEVLEILKFDERELGNFETLLNNKEQIEEGYNKLDRITNKPSFEEVYKSILDFLEKEKLIGLNQDLEDIEK